MYAGRESNWPQSRKQNIHPAFGTYQTSKSGFSEHTPSIYNSIVMSDWATVSIFGSPSGRINKWQIRSQIGKNAFWLHKKNLCRFARARKRRMDWDIKRNVYPDLKPRAALSRSLVFAIWAKQQIIGAYEPERRESERIPEWRLNFWDGFLSLSPFWNVIFTHIVIVRGCFRVRQRIKSLI